MREPRVATARRTMLYMAASLAITAGGILLGYYLVGVQPKGDETLNAVLVEKLGFGEWFVVLTLVAEGGLLIVAAQTGFLDGPRVMANMAVDGWLPHRFSALSERLTMHLSLIHISYLVCQQTSWYLSVANGTYVSLWLPAGLFVAALLITETVDLSLIHI